MAQTSNGSGCQFSDLNTIAANLLDNALTVSSQRTYNKAVLMYKTFMNSLYPAKECLPASVNDILLFIAHCFQLLFAASTVTTYCSALSYVHKINNWQDPLQTFIIKKCLQGYHKLKPSCDVRLPITPEILSKIIQSLPYTCQSHFLRTVWKAMYLLAFHAF